MDQSQYKDVGDIQYLQSSIFQAFTKRKMENKVAEAPVELIAQAMDCFIKPKHHRDSGWMGAQVPSLQELRTSFFLPVYNAAPW